MFCGFVYLKHGKFQSKKKVLSFRLVKCLSLLPLDRLFFFTNPLYSIWFTVWQVKFQTWIPLSHRVKHRTETVMLRQGMTDCFCEKKTKLIIKIRFYNKTTLEINTTVVLIYLTILITKYQSGWFFQTVSIRKFYKIMNLI